MIHLKVGVLGQEGLTMVWIPALIKQIIIINKTSTNILEKSKGVKVVLVPSQFFQFVVVRAQRVALDGTIRIEGLIGPDIDQTLCGKTIIRM